MRFKTALYAFGAVGLVAVITLLSIRQEEEPFLWSPEFSQMKADLVLYDVTYRHDSRQESGGWTVKAAEARLYEARDEMEFEQVEIVIDGEGGPISVRARQGLYHLGSGAMSVSGDVKVVSPDGYLLETQSLRFDKEAGVVKTRDRAVLLGDNGARLEGEGFVYHLRDHRLVMTRPVALIPEEDAGL